MASAALAVLVFIGYLYNADGERVAKGTITQMSCDPTANGFIGTSNETDSILGLNGEQVTEVKGAMTWKHTNIWAGGQLLGTWDAQGTHFYLNDWLGNRRFQATFYGTLEQTCQNQPFGDALNCTGSGPELTERHFTGKERDAESGNDYFPARYYSSSMERWLSPDWNSDPDPVPWADFSDPQSLNLYSYLENNPLNKTDPDRHVCDQGSVGPDGVFTIHCWNQPPKKPMQTGKLNPAIWD